MKKILNIFVFSALAVATCGTVIGMGIKGQNIESASAYYKPGTTYTNHDAATYYNSISDTLEGNSLLTALRTLNLNRRKREIGYKTMGTSANSSPYIYTDYDPSTVQKDSNGQPYGTKLLSFYSGTSMTSYNKEHVWPASRLPGGRDGNVVDDDIFMARPTITAENSNRGNSVYYEGKVSSSGGWDPVAAFSGNIGTYTSIRGECARIVFYCMTVDSTLVLNENTSNSGNNMGRLTDLLRWNLQNPVNEREKNRNEGGEYLQGNRNAFVDHPEYACKIWGNTSDATKAICSGTTPTPPTPDTKGTLDNPYTPSEARTATFSGQAYVKGDAQNIQVSGDKVTLTLFDIGNMTAETGINVYNMDLEGKTINAGDIVTVKATKSTANASLVAPGFIYSVEKSQSNGGGCGGSIVTSSIILFSSALAGFSLVVIKKNKKKKEENE